MNATVTCEKCGKPLGVFDGNTCAECSKIEQIRQEIADLDDAEYEFEGYYKAVNDALQIIDKYR